MRGTYAVTGRAELGSTAFGAGDGAGEASDVTGDGGTAGAAEGIEAAASAATGFALSKV